MPNELSPYALMHDKFPKSEGEILQRLEEMKNYVQELGVLAVCFHGISQSGALIEVLEDRKLFGAGLKADNTGVDLLVRQVGLTSLHSWPEERRKIFVEKLANVLSSAQRIALFVESGRISGTYQKEILTAILQAAEKKETPVYQVSQTADYKRLLNELRSAYPVE